MNKKIVKSISIYRDSKLPENGWMQSCFNCYIFTAKNILFKTHVNKNTTHEFFVYLCPLCQREFKKKNNEKSYIIFQNKCNDYIAFNYYV